jgi:hypothetical protein
LSPHASASTPLCSTPVFSWCSSVSDAVSPLGCMCWILPHACPGTGQHRCCQTGSRRKLCCLPHSVCCSAFPALSHCLALVPCPWCSLPDPAHHFLHSHAAACPKLPLPPGRGDGCPGNA